MRHSEHVDENLHAHGSVYLPYTAAHHDDRHIREGTFEIIRVRPVYHSKVGHLFLDVLDLYLHSAYDRELQTVSFRLDVCPAYLIIYVHDNRRRAGQALLSKETSTMNEPYVPKHMRPPQRTRVELFDALRGFSILSMVAFHACYDLAYLAHLPQLSWFAPPLEIIWRCSISWTFLLVAGCMCLFSRNNLRRAAKYLAVAVLIWVATTIARADIPINFGIIFCMGACTLIYALLERVGPRSRGVGIAPRGYVAAAVLFLGFLALQGLQTGTIWAFGAQVDMPDYLYATPWFSWLGFPGPGFASGDYYPVLPYLLLFLAGASVMARLKENGLPGWLCAPVPTALRWLMPIGRHTLIIYVVHQPLILGVLMLAGLV